MKSFRILLGVAVAVLVLVVSWVATHEFHLQDRLLMLSLSTNLSGMTWASFEQFLAVLIVALLVTLVVTVGVSLGILSVTRRALHRSQSAQHAHEAAVQQAIDRLKAQSQREYERLMTLSSTLTQRLDKRALFHNILQATSQVTSVPQVNSVVGLWVLSFETERLCFEMGTRCDESFFSQTDFSLSEAPFAQLLAKKQPMRFDQWDKGFPFVKPEKASQLGEVPGLILIPLIIERTLLGCLVVFCHPGLFKSYEAQGTFFDAAWGQLALALAIAIQGELAILDRLTGIVNQTYFLKRLSQEIERADRYQLPMGVLMIDIDNFKAVNDTLGHPQGDEVLKIVSRLIRKEVRVIDLVARYGGEEFVVMMPETGLREEGDSPAEESKDKTGVVIVSERIRKAVEEEFKVLQRPLCITVSIGVVVRRHPEDRGVDARGLIRVADTELYKAKTMGKNRVSVHVPEDTKFVS